MSLYYEVLNRLPLTLKSEFMKNLPLGITAFCVPGAWAATKALELDKGCRCGLQQRRIELSVDVSSFFVLSFFILYFFFAFLDSLSFDMLSLGIVSLDMLSVLVLSFFISWCLPAAKLGAAMASEHRATPVIISFLMPSPSQLRLVIRTAACISRRSPRRK
jgi:hypothetical protein